MRSDALEEVYDAYERELFLYALSLCRDRALAEELVAETFYRALLTLDSGTPSVKYWLLRVCKNLFLDWVRKGRRRSFEPLCEDWPDPDEGMLERILRDERRRALYRGMLRLGDADRELLQLFYFAGCPVAEIARLLQKSPSAIKTGLSRARARLKMQMEGEPI